MVTGLVRLLRRLALRWCRALGVAYLVQDFDSLTLVSSLHK